MTERGYTIENSGENNGLIVGDNTGTINLSIQRAIQIPSLISTVVKSLGEICSSDEYSECLERFQDYRTDEKIEYNGVVKYKNIIQEFSVYYSTCDKHLNIYDDSNIQGKDFKMCSFMVLTSQGRNTCR